MNRRIPFALVSALAAVQAPLCAQQWTATNLSQARQGVTAVTVGSQALFAGGRVGNTTFNVVDIYDSSLGTPSTPGAWSVAALSLPRAGIAAAAVGNLALFAGGGVTNTTSTAVVDVYDVNTGVWSLGRPLSVPRGALSATTVGSLVLFAGGGSIVGGAPVVSNVVDIYDSSLGLPDNPAAWSTATLSVGRGVMGAVTVGSKALFAGGQDSTIARSEIDVFNASLGRPALPSSWSQAFLSQARNFPDNAATALGSRAYFAAGQTGQFSPPSAVVDIYDDAAGAWSTTDLSVARSHLGVAATSGTVVFAGGLVSTGPFNVVDVVDVLNASSGAFTTSAKLTTPRFDLGTTTVGSWVLFAGGHTGAAVSSLVDIYEPIGTPYCNATVNSTGKMAGISAAGSASLAANSLKLVVSGVPNTPFLFFHGPSQAQLPFGNGFRCVGGTIQRVPGMGVAVAGVASVNLDFAALGITAPTVRNFQCWYRDAAAGGAGTNTSDAIEISLTP